MFFYYYAYSDIVDTIGDFSQILIASLHNVLSAKKVDIFQLGTLLSGA